MMPWTLLAVISAIYLLASLHSYHVHQRDLERWSAERQRLEGQAVHLARIADWQERGRLEEKNRAKMLEEFIVLDARRRVREDPLAGTSFYSWLAANMANRGRVTD